MSSYKEKYAQVKNQVDRRMGRSLGKWGVVKAFFNSDNFTDRRKQIIDHEFREFNRTSLAEPVIKPRGRRGSFDAQIDLISGG